jgi:CheY-like chemotaxis protein
LHYPVLVSEEKEKAKTTLLVVDDDRAVRKLLERIAVRAGFDVTGAKDGEHAMELLSQRLFEIVIVDLMMPRVSGYELVQKISAMTPRPTVIVATAMANGDVARLDDSMVRRVIRKPFDIEAVAKTLVEVAAEVAAGKQVAPPPEVKVVRPEEAPPPINKPC